LASFLSQEIVLGQVFNPITAHFLETSVGAPGQGVLCKLFKKTHQNNQQWELISSQLTDGFGRVGQLISEEDFTLDSYKIWFDSEEYYGRTSTPTWYPFVEILFDVTDLSIHYHVPLLVSPFGFSSYKGSFSTSSTTPPPVPNPIRGFLLDTVNGLPAANVLGKFYRLTNSNHWQLLVTKNTTSSGLFDYLFTNPCDFTAGTYKMSFDTKTYWTSKGYDSFFPSVDVFVKISEEDTQGSGVQQAPILISPYSFTTNKGNSSAVNPVTC